VLALKVATLAMGDQISDVANKNSVAIATLANEILLLKIVSDLRQVCGFLRDFLYQ
jgi:hypothetical protein